MAFMISGEVFQQQPNGLVIPKQNREIERCTRLLLKILGICRENSNALIVSLEHGI